MLAIRNHQSVSIRQMGKLHQITPIQQSRLPPNNSEPDKRLNQNINYFWMLATASFALFTTAGGRLT